VIETPHVDWLALSPTLALLGASAIALLGAVTVPRPALRVFSVAVTGVGFVVSGVFAGIVFDRSPDSTVLLSESMTRDQPRLVGRRAEGPRRRVLRAPRGVRRRDGLHRLRLELDDDVPRA
jgi:hypothetical protein